MSAPASGVLVVGEAIMDVVRALDGSETRVVGGFGVNVATALGRLGEPVTFRAAMGDDADGDRIRRHLTESDVALALSPIERTATSVATLSADGSARYEFDLRWELTEEAPPAEHLHTGSIAMFLEPGATSVAETVASGRYATVSVDPNIRPTLLGTKADARARFESLAAMAHLVKLSDEDAEWMYPGVELERVIELVAELGPRLVVATRGSEGALLRRGGIEIVAVPPATSVVDTIGAGDTFMAGLIHALRAEGATGDAIGAIDAAALTRVARFAAAAAALCVARRGAEPPRLAEVEQLLARTDG